MGPYHYLRISFRREPQELTNTPTRDSLRIRGRDGTARSVPSMASNCAAIGDWQRLDPAMRDPISSQEDLEDAQPEAFADITVRPRRVRWLHDPRGPRRFVEAR